MSVPFALAAALAFGVGLAHSLLGERYIVSRLLRRDNLPRLFGSDAFTKQTLRFAWHLTSVAWWGFGAILLVLAFGGDVATSIAQVIVVTFVASAAMTAAGSGFRHPAWIVFVGIAALALIG